MPSGELIRVAYGGNELRRCCCSLVDGRHVAGDRNRACGSRRALRLHGIGQMALAAGVSVLLDLNRR